MNQLPRIWVPHGMIEEILGKPPISAKNISYVTKQEVSWEKYGTNLIVLFVIRYHHVAVKELPLWNKPS